jgi:hypothetical protein
LEHLLNGSLPKTGTEVLSTLLVVVSMASLMDENSFCLDDILHQTSRSPHLQSVLEVVPDWILLIPCGKTIENYDNLVADLWGVIRATPVDDLTEYHRYSEQIRTEKNLLLSIHSEEAGTFQNTREAIKDFSLFREDPISDFSRHVNLRSGVREHGISRLDSWLEDIEVLFVPANEAETNPRLPDTTIGADAASSQGKPG